MSRPKVYKIKVFEEEVEMPGYYAFSLTARTPEETIKTIHDSFEQSKLNFLRNIKNQNND